MAAPAPDPESAQAPEQAGRCAALLAHYQAAADALRPLPLFNARLQIELEEWSDTHQAGVLITPWCLNLVWLPSDQVVWPGKGGHLVLKLTSGEYDLIAAEAPGCGRFATASLVSDMHSLADQPAARELAARIAELLFNVAPTDQSRRGFLRRALRQGGLG